MILPYSEENLLMNIVEFLQNNFFVTEVKYVLKIKGPMLSEPPDPGEYFIFDEDWEETLGTERIKIVYETEGRLEFLELPPFHKGSRFEGLILNMSYNIKDLVGEYE